MIYFELIIACLLGANSRVYLPDDLTWADGVSHLCLYIGAILCVLFPVIIIVAIWIKIKPRKGDQVFDEEVITNAVTTKKQQQISDFIEYNPSDDNQIGNDK